MSARYFISRSGDGSISHLVRITETETTLYGEFFIDGRWVEDGTSMEYLLDSTLGEEVDEAQAEAIVSRLGGADDPEPLDRSQSDAVRAGLAALLPSDAPALPDPITARGTVSGGGWTITYVTGLGGQAGVDVLAQSPLSSPIHAHIAADGTAQVLDSFEYEYGYDPEVPGDREAAQERMEAHNRRVHDELVRKQLI